MMMQKNMLVISLQGKLRDLLWYFQQTHLQLNHK